MDDGPLVVDERLPPEPVSVGRARRLLRAAASTVPAEVAESAELLVSELVSNALVHVGGQIGLRVSLPAPASILVGVSDGGAHGPVLRHFADTAGTGRGLKLLDDLSDEWGVVAEDDGKTVWFRVGSTSEKGSGAGRAPTVHRLSSVPSHRARETVRVELLNVPVLLHSAWQERVAAVLREYLLVSLEDVTMTEQVARHAECSDALALLSDVIPEPAPPRGEDAERAEQWSPLVTLVVPAESLAHFDTLDETMDAAIGLADSDVMLTPGPDPAMRRFRRWVCEQVRCQAKGEPPAPWQPG